MDSPSLNDTNGRNKWRLHSMGELLRPLRLLGEHGMRRLANGDAAQRFADRVAQLFGRRLLWGGQDTHIYTHTASVSLCAASTVTSCHNSASHFTIRQRSFTPVGRQFVYSVGTCVSVAACACKWCRSLLAGLVALFSVGCQLGLSLSMTPIWS